MCLQLLWVNCVPLKDAGILTPGPYKPDLPGCFVFADAIRLRGSDTRLRWGPKSNEWYCFFPFFFSFPYFGHTQGIWKFLGQGFNPSPICDLFHSCSNAESFIHCSTVGIAVNGILIRRIRFGDCCGLWRFALSSPNSDVQTIISLHNGIGMGPLEYNHGALLMR